jgi:hypothetical protein
MQRYTVVFITIIALYVSGGSSAHHQELKLYIQQRVFVELFLLLTAIVGELQLIHDSGKKQKKRDKYPMLYIQF